MDGVTRSLLVGSCLGLVLGVLAGVLLQVITGAGSQVLQGVLWGGLGGAGYGLLIGYTAWKTRSRSQIRRRKGFVLARLVLVFPVCVVLVLFPGALAGLLGEAGEFGERSPQWSALNLLLGFLLAGYVAFLWIRLLRRSRT